jgi:hypothetical protein
MSDVLMLEPNEATRSVVRQAIECMHLRPLTSESWDDALSQAERGAIGVFVADWQSLVVGLDLRDELQLTNRFRSVLAQLSATMGAPLPPSVILTAGASSADAYESAHAAAIIAGVDVFLGPEDLRFSTILESYLARFGSERTARAMSPTRRAPEPIRRAPSADPVHSTTEGPQYPRASHVADAFDLPAAHLRDSASGRWDAKKIAAALGIELKPLAEAIHRKYGTAHKTPHALSLQDALAPLGNVLAMLAQIYGGDQQAIRAWLRGKQRQLGGQEPLAALLEPGRAPLVEQWVAGLWLGEPT